MAILTPVIRAESGEDVNSLFLEVYGDYDKAEKLEHSGNRPAALQLYKEAARILG